MNNTTSNTRPIPGIAIELLIALCFGFLIGYSPSATAEEIPNISDIRNKVKENGDSKSDQLVFAHVAESEWSAGQSHDIIVNTFEDWKVDRIYVAFRSAGDQHYEELPLKRAEGTLFAVLISGEKVQPPALEYYIASIDKKGQTNFHFAEPDSPHTILVHGETKATKTADRLKRHHGNRASFLLKGNWTRLGSRSVRTGYDYDNYEDTWTTTEPGTDQFWTGNLQFTYRLLAGAVYEIRTGIGIMRGDLAAYKDDDGELIPVGVDPSSEKPGLNSGYVGIGFEIFKYLSFDVDLLFGANEEGFVFGVGGLMRIGRIADTRFEVGGLFKTDAGSSAFFRFAWHTVPDFPMALTVELDDMPLGEESPISTRLIYTLTWEMTDHWAVSVDAGYASRSDATESGFILGLTTRFEF